MEDIEEVIDAVIGTGKADPTWNGLVTYDCVDAYEYMLEGHDRCVELLCPFPQLSLHLLTTLPLLGPRGCEGLHTDDTLHKGVW